jgi:rhodanese-related sulfurtransferase
VGFLSKWFGKTPEPKPQPSPAAAPVEPEIELDELRLPWTELSPAECAERIAQGGLVVLDVRMKQEHESRRIPGSKLVPVQVLRQRLDELDKEATYLVHCEHGMRSTDACAFLYKAGFRKLFEMAGGLSVYTGPTERGPVA